MRVAPLALLLGGLLRVLGDDRVALPFAHSAVLVRNLTPGLTTILLAWVAQDQWVGCQVALARRPWVLAGARTTGAAALCLGAAALALLGLRETVLFWLCVCFTGPAVLLTQHLALWWAVPMLAQVALLKAGPFWAASPAVDLLVRPVVAVTVLTGCLVLASALRQARPRDDGG